MDWIAVLANAIAVFRLVLICSGMWTLIRYLIRTVPDQELQRKYFAVSGVIYLLGLIPQSLLLLLLNSDMMSFMLDNGYLCWMQKSTYIIAIILHNFILLNWILHSIHVPQKSYFATIVKNKFFTFTLGFYTTVIILFRGYMLRKDDGKRFFTDVASKPGNASSSGWSMTPVDNPSQVVRLQLLLCESSLSEKEIMRYLIFSYATVMLPIFILHFIVGSPLLQFMGLNALPCSGESNMCNEQEMDKGGQQYTWWEQEVNIQRFLSAAVAIWFHLIQPFIYAIHRHHFVDFGSHLLLTLCVFIPWTFSNK
ncbi:hypothetical protein X975_05688, partial [Stegodyphus mimosarum]